MLRAQLMGRPDLQASWAAAREAGGLEGILSHQYYD